MIKVPPPSPSTPSIGVNHTSTHATFWLIPSPTPESFKFTPTVGESKCTRVPSSSLEVRLSQEGTNNLPHRHFREKIKDCFQCLLPHEGNLIWVQSWSTTIAAFFANKTLSGLNQGGSRRPIEKRPSVQQTDAFVSQRDTLCLMD